MKFNHNEFLTYPNKFDQIMFGSDQAGVRTWARSRSAPRSTSAPTESARQIVEVAQAFQAAHELGMATILWCYLRNPAFKKDKDYHVSADLTGQANHLGVTIEADIIKQKLPENNGGYKALASKENPYGKTDERIYTELTQRPPDRPHAATRSLNCYMGRAGLINSGGASGDERLRRRREDRRHQQARRRHGPHLRPQGLPAPDERGREAAADDPGRLPLQGRHDRVAVIAVRSSNVATTFFPATSVETLPESVSPSHLPA